MHEELIRRQRLSKITCWVYRNLSPYVNEVLRELALPEVYLQSARSVVLESKRSLLGLRSQTRLDENLCDIYRFYVPPKYELQVMSTVATRADLFMAGRGSIYSEEVTLLRRAELEFNDSLLRELDRAQLPIQTGFAGICCIVQRGDGNLLARSILEMGFSVPVVTYGKGMGIRDKLGLLRITIPVDKEVINFVVNKQDAEEVLRLVSDKARLEHPGRGFIYMFPIRNAVLNTKIHRGAIEQVASIEQIVAAIDELSGNAVWRRRTAASRRMWGKKRFPLLTELANYTIIDVEGHTADLVRRAMDAGAGGATLSALRFEQYAHEAGGTEARSREMSDLIIDKRLVEHILASSLTHGLATEHSNASVELSSVEMASTYQTD